MIKRTKSLQQNIEVYKVSNGSQYNNIYIYIYIYISMLYVYSLYILHVYINYIYIYIYTYTYIYIYKFTSKCYSQTTSSSERRSPRPGNVFSTPY